MVVTSNMEEFISNIRNERMNQFWNDTKKYQTFSPTPDVQYDIHEGKDIGISRHQPKQSTPLEMQKHDDTDLGERKHSASNSKYFDTLQMACQYAIDNKYRAMLRTPRGKKFYFWHKVGGKNPPAEYEDIISRLTPLAGCTCWTAEHADPHTTEKQGFQIRNTVIAHVSKQYFRTDEEAMSAAVSAQFKCMVKLSEPNQYKFVYPQSGTKKKDNILSELVMSPMHTTWVF